VRYLARNVPELLSKEDKSRKPPPLLYIGAGKHDGCEIVMMRVN
jgi:hypothetical protein